MMMDDIHAIISPTPNKYSMDIPTTNNEWTHQLYVEEEDIFPILLLVFRPIIELFKENLPCLNYMNFSLKNGEKS